MPQEKPPDCSTEDGETDDAKEELDQNLADSHGDEEDNDTSQYRGNFQDRREFACCYLGKDVRFHGCSSKGAVLDRAITAKWHGQAGAVTRPPINIHRPR